MDDPVLFASLTGAIAALFAALLAEMRGSRDVWRRLYEREMEKHDETRRLSAETTRQSARSIDAMAATLDKILQTVNDLPRRRDDWQSARPGDRSRE